VGCVGVVTASTAGHCTSNSSGRSTDLNNEENSSANVISKINNRDKTNEDELQDIGDGNKYLSCNVYFILLYFIMF